MADSTPKVTQAIYHCAPLTFRKEAIIDMLNKVHQAVLHKHRIKEEDVVWFLRNVLKAGYVLFTHNCARCTPISLRIGEKDCCLSLASFGTKSSYTIGTEPLLGTTAMIISAPLYRTIYGEAGHDIMMRDIKVPHEFWYRKNMAKYVTSPLLREFAIEVISKKLTKFSDILP